MPSPSTPARGERELIRRIARELDPPPPGWVPIGDDMASAAEDVLWTTDMVMDGVDFDSRSHSWRDIGWKAMAVNLSDCAAMAARPASALVSVALEDRLSMDDAVALLRGCRDCAGRFGCVITGGDTNSWAHPSVVSVTVAGRMPAGRQPVLRSGARPGDRLFVSGRLGGSILGRHLTFEPRVELALRLAECMPIRAMIDVSDGLSVDLAHVATASGCGAEVKESLLHGAIHDDARRLAAQTGRRPIDHALHDGEDFELLVALDPAVSDQEAAALGLLPLGRFVAAPGVWLRLEQGGTAAIEPRGWEHFR